MILITNTASGKPGRPGKDGEDGDDGKDYYPPATDKPTTDYVPVTTKSPYPGGQGCWCRYGSRRYWSADCNCNRAY